MHPGVHVLPSNEGVRQSQTGLMAPAAVSHLPSLPMAFLHSLGLVSASSPWMQGQW